MVSRSHFSPCTASSLELVPSFKHDAPRTLGISTTWQRSAGTYIFAVVPVHAVEQEVWWAFASTCRDILHILTSRDRSNFLVESCRSTCSCIEYFQSGKRSFGCVYDPYHSNIYVCAKLTLPFQSGDRIYTATVQDWLWPARRWQGVIFSHLRATGHCSSLFCEPDAMHADIPTLGSLRRMRRASHEGFNQRAIVKYESLQRREALYTAIRILDSPGTWEGGVKRYVCLLVPHPCVICFYQHLYRVLY